MFSREYVFFRATSDIFARVFCGFWYAFLKIRVVRAFSGPLARFSWPLARFSCLFRVFRVFRDFRVFRVFRDFRLGGFRSFDFVIFSIFHWFSWFLGQLWSFFIFTFFTRFHGHSAFLHGQSHAFSRYHFFGRLAIITNDTNSAENRTCAK